MNVTGLPGQKGLPEAVIVTLTGNTALTDTGYWMLEAGLFVEQASEEVKVQETRSPFTGMKEYVLLLLPTGLLFTNH